jgi:hypothetical protein
MLRISGTSPWRTFAEVDLLKENGFTGCGKTPRSCFKSIVLYQGTTSVVPNNCLKSTRALAPAGCFSYFSLWNRPSSSASLAAERSSIVSLGPVQRFPDEPLGAPQQQTIRTTERPPKNVCSGTCFGIRQFASPPVEAKNNC